MLLGFSISGVTPGYERFDHWTTTDEKMNSILKEKSIVLDTSRINIPPRNGEIVRIRRFLEEGHLVVYIGIYRHAFGKGGGRGGGYMSAGVWLSGDFLNGVVLLPVVRKILGSIEQACCQDSEFVSSLERKKDIFSEKLRTECNNIANEGSSLPSHFIPAELSSNSMFYDFSNLGVGADTFLVNYLQASRSHSSIGDIVLTTSISVVEGTRRAAGIEIFNEFHLATMELEGASVSPSTGRVDNLTREPSMPAGRNIRSSVDAYAIERVMTKIGAIEEQLGSVLKANRRNGWRIDVIYGIMALVLVVIVLGKMLTYLVSMWRGGVAADIAVSSSAPTAVAADIVVSSNAPTVVLSALVRMFEKETGNKVTVNYEDGPAIINKIKAGGGADLVINASAVIDELVKDGKIDGPRTEVFISDVGLAVKGGAPKQDAKLHTRIVYSAGVPASAKQPDAAKELLKFFGSPAAVAVIKAKGLQPALVN